MFQKVTAFFVVILLGKKLNIVKWASLIILIIGIALVQVYRFIKILVNAVDAC